MTELVIDYTPREHFIPFHQRSQRWACLVVHRRGGKTVACINDLGTRALYTPKKDARYAYLAPFYRQAKDVAWQYTKTFLEPIITKVRESQLRVELFNGSWITLYGADNPDALRGIYLDGVILDEFGDCRPSLWGQVILPCLVDRKGWAVFIGTPKGKNHFYNIFRRSQKEEGWYNLTLPVSKSNIISPIDLEEVKVQMTEEEYLQEMECSFEASVRGAFYTKILNDLEAAGQIDDELRYNAEQPVSVSSDLGYTDSSAFWFWQSRPDGLALIDYVEAHGEPLSYYFDMLRKKPYKYDTIHLPHDAKAKTLQTGRSTIEQFLNEFNEEDDPQINIVPKLDIQDGINAVKKILPSCWFNRVNCYEGIEALRAYRRVFDETTGSYRDKPIHDWASNGSDAFRYLALVAQPLAGYSKPESMIELAEGHYPFSLDQLYDLRKDRSWNKLRL